MTGAVGEHMSNERAFATESVMHDTNVPAPGEARRFSHAAAEPALLTAARAGEARFGVVFGGQGASWLGELAALHAAHPAVRTLVRAASERLRASSSSVEMGALAADVRGFSLQAWAETPASAPSAALSSSLLSQPGIFVTQMAHLVALAERGFDPAVLTGHASVATGHSQGVMAALVVAEGHGLAPLATRVAEIATYFLWQGYRMQEAFLASAPAAAVLRASEAAGLGVPTPMAALNGLSRERLEEALAAFHAANPHLAPIDVALDNGFVRKVVSGPTASLVAFARALAERKATEKDAFARGRLDRLPMDFQWEFVAASAPFHSQSMEPARRALPADLAREGIAFDPRALKLPVLAHDGRDLRTCTDGAALRDALVTMQHVEPVLWGDVCRALRTSVPGGLTHVLDLGPGDAVAKLTAANLRGFGVHVFPAATEAGRRALLVPSKAELPRALDYTQFRPRLSIDAEGKARIANRFTTFAARPPFFLPGMTPTTADAPIVAAAANAGFVAELAGGGQVTERHFRLRARELSRLLEPGAAYQVNLLHLDPYLWNLQWKNEALVPRLRAEGAAIEGIVVSAGVPELAEAKELLATCRTQGIRLVSFKPGTVAQVKRVLEIAAAHPDLTIGVQVEGGKAGGHHSWEDLRELIRATYHQLREHRNVVLSVGGGIRTEADAYAWLSGTWSEALGLAPMPVDAVFLGTLLMAAAEAKTSPQVKELLVRTTGTGEWVANGVVKGGVTSGRSQLDADIHYCDNAAARSGRLLDQVAGKRDLVLARRDEIIEALGRTAKPYFGDVAGMTPAAMLRRFVSLAAIGRGSEYEDGRWPDSSYRARALDLVRHLESRLVREEGPSLARGSADLDNPEEFVARFVEVYPHAETVTLGDADAEHFVRRICQRPGKPVNFVPVIDEDVRRWFKADSLWASHDDRYDADAVLVIPGIEAVAGITRVDEPVGETLRRFERHAIDQLLAAGVVPEAPRDRALDGGALAEAAARAGLTLVSAGGVIRAEAARREPGDVQSFLEALDPVALAPIASAAGVARDRSIVANPLARLLRVAPGDQWRATLDASGRLQELVVRRSSGHALECRLVRNGTAARCDVTLVHRLEAGAELRLELSFERDLAHPDRFPRDVTPSRSGRVSDFYRTAMAGGGEPVPAGESIRAQFRVDRAFVREYALATGDASPAHVGHAPGRTLPLCSAFSAAFGAIFRATFVPGVAWDPSRLVHLDNAIELTGAPLREGEELEVTARLVSWEPGTAGIRIRTEALLDRNGSTRARVTSTFFVQGETSTFRFRRERRTFELPVDAALVSLLAAKPWVRPEADHVLVPSAAHRAEIELSTSRDGDRVYAGVTGVVRDGTGAIALRIAEFGIGKDATELDAARWLVHFAPAAAHAVTLTQASAEHVERTTAPLQLEDFARASLDRNPLHRDPHAAALAGFDRPIVHGQWTAARAVASAVAGFAAGDASRVRSVEVSFTDVVLPGDALELSVKHVAMHEGSLVVEVAARVAGAEEGRVALRGRVTLAPPKTAYVFPGQGVQTAGMGMDGYARSAAARRVWDEADRCCRETLGFSLLTVVRENPTAMRVGRELLRHEQGVLFLTQFTQVAMCVMAIAQVAELRESGCFQEDAAFCGHSVGEYSAIGAVTDLLPLQAIVEIVYQRGLTMQHFVERDADGRSPYRMGVVRPNVARMSEAELVALVRELAHETGLLLEVVNFNVAGRQYSVVGHVPALERLEAELARRTPLGGKSAYITVPGIDVPFHSHALRGGVAAFRAKLEAVVRPGFDTAQLVGRYVPNLVARPFSLERAYFDDVLACTGSEVLTALRDRWDADGMPPAELGRALFIEGLAYQFASPVRWIETQDLLVARGETGVERVIEIGVASSPTQANMLRQTLSLDAARIDPPAVLHVELDRKIVFHVHETAAEPVAVPKAVQPAPAHAAAPAVSAPVSTSAATPVTDAPLTVRDSLLTLLALKARVRVDEVKPDENVEALFGGNSSRRNAVLADLGAEFGIGAIDAAHELPVAKLAEALEKATGGKYRTQGNFLRAQLTAALKPLGFGARDLLETLTAKGLPEGRALAMLNRITLWARTGDSTRNGALSPVAPPAAGDRGALQTWLDACVARYCADEGIALGVALTAGGGATVDAAALDALLGKYFGVGGAFLESLRFAESALGHDVWSQLEVSATDDAEDRERLNRYDAEHGASYDKAIRPAFVSEKAVVFGGAWAWSRREATALFHDLVAGRVALVGVGERLRRIARGADAATARTVRYLGRRARSEHRAEIADLFDGLANELGTLVTPTAASEAKPVRPRVSITDEGALRVTDELRDAPTADAAARALAEIATLATTSGSIESATLHAGLSALAGGTVSFAGRTALVTGASEGSIALEVVKVLLTGGARVVVTTSSLSPERVKFYRRLYQRFGARGSELAIVPFNQGSRQDVQRLVAWLGSAETTTVGGKQKTVKEPWLVDLLVPFGAIGEEGTLAELSDRSLATLRVLLFGVEALIGELASFAAKQHLRDARMHVLLPLSPNHGQFGNDGLYGETKAGLEALLHRWKSESSAWGRYVSLVGARIGWVRGTGLMSVNDAIAPGLEDRAGVRTFSSAEMGLLLSACCTEGVRELSAREALVADLTGGMDRVPALGELARELRTDVTGRVALAKRRRALEQAEARALGASHEGVSVSPRAVLERHFAFPALPSVERRRALSDLRNLDLSQVSVIVGLGEVGPFGSARTRWSYESTGELSLEACVELAWMTGRIRFEKGRDHVGWVDAQSGQPVAEREVKTKYERALLDDAGIRIVDPKAHGFDPRNATVWADVVLERELVFPVPSKADGEAYVEAAGSGARLVFDPAKDGWFVVRAKGSLVKVARAARLDRYVAGQVPAGWDATRYGIPKSMVEQVDRTTLFNLVATVEAFLSAGLEPEELAAYLHPSQIGNTQGSGIGGMQKLKRLYLDWPLDRPRQGDALQETLINVTAAWIVQSIVGSYGPMVHPVGACATAAVSIEEAADKIATGKAAFVVAGGYDDYGEEGAVGFSDMAATADTNDMLARGIPPREMSRPNDRRRRGFVEAQGGGTVLVARADLAVQMGLPIHAVVALARSYGDGIHRSIPAPGPGVMAVASERRAEEGELGGAQLCSLPKRVAEWERFLASIPLLRQALSAEALERIVRDERRRMFHAFHADDERVSPLRRALATFGLGPDDVAAAWKHDTSTEANDPNENQAYHQLLSWLGRAPGNPLVVVSQKAITGHAKGGAAAWQLAGLCQGLSSGVIPGNPNLDDPDPAMRKHETVAFSDRPLATAPGAFEAGFVTSLGFGHVGAIVLLVHPDRVLAALDDEAFAAYAERRSQREAETLRKHLAILEGGRPAVRIRTEKSFVASPERYPGMDAEHAALLDAASRRLGTDGPIVAGGRRARS